MTLSFQAVTKDTSKPSKTSNQHQVAARVLGGAQCVCLSRSPHHCLLLSLPRISPTSMQREWTHELAYGRYVRTILRCVRAYILRCVPEHLTLRLRIRVDNVQHENKMADQACSHVIACVVQPGTNQLDLMAHDGWWTETEEDKDTILAVKKISNRLKKLRVRLARMRTATRPYVDIPYV